MSYFVQGGEGVENIPKPACVLNQCPLFKVALKGLSWFILVVHTKGEPDLKLIHRLCGAFWQVSESLNSIGLKRPRNFSICVQKSINFWWAIILCNSFWFIDHINILLCRPIRLIGLDLWVGGGVFITSRHHGQCWYYDAKPGLPVVNCCMVHSSAVLGCIYEARFNH